MVYGLEFHFLRGFGPGVLGFVVISLTLRLVIWNLKRFAQPKMSASWLPKIRLSASSEQESSRNCQKLSNQGEILDPSLMILDSLRNIRSREERPIYTILQIMVAWRSCCKTPSKVQYTYFCCLSDPEFQFLHRHGQKDDETNSPGLHCKRGTQMLEIFFCPFGMWLLLFN